MSASPPASPTSRRALRGRRVLLGARSVYRKALGDTPLVSYNAVQLTGQQASDHIRDRLREPGGTLIARLGSGELECICTYLGIHGSTSALRRSVAFIRGQGGPLWWDRDSLHDLIVTAGFFPPDFSLAERFCTEMLNDMRLTDVLGSWLSWERVVDDYLNQAVRVRLSDLEPYYHRDPWSEVLRGKTILVVHPFVQSITSQYARRELLFADQRVLPEFELKTVKAVQSYAGNPTSFHTWFDALDHMRDAIDMTDFDIAIIGAGAYGFPLAAHVKRLGKKAVHLGGATQILFGIKGRRWDDHPTISSLYNNAWVRPRPSETPKNFLAVDRGSYW